MHTGTRMGPFQGAHATRMTILRALRMLARSVGLMYGPGGGSVMLERTPHESTLTYDGVLVAHAVPFADRWERAIARIVAAAAEDTVARTRDGGKLMILLACELTREGIKRTAADEDPAQVGDRLRAEVGEVLRRLHEGGRPLTAHDDIVGAATAAARGDAGIGVLAAKALDLAGVDGGVMIESSQDATCSVRLGAERTAIIQLGARDRNSLDDASRSAHRAVRAARAARRHGAVTGGGIGLLRSVGDLPADSLLLPATLEVVSVLVTNAGHDGHAIAHQIWHADVRTGFNIATRRLEDLQAARVWDPLDTIEGALDGAVSLTCGLLGAGGALKAAAPSTL